MAPRVIVTRVQPQAQTWLEQLAQAGFDALALPLIDLAPTSQRQAVRGAWQSWQGWSAVMFVSAAAVEGLVAAVGLDAVHVHSQDLTRAPRLWCTGPGTQAALLAQGFAASAIDAPPAHSAQLDSEALWQQVRAQVRPGARVLVVRGDDGDSGPGDGAERTGVGRDWLAQQLRVAGAEVVFVAAYERRLPQWTHEQCSLARSAAQDGSIWLFSSAQALRHLRLLLPDLAWGQARALCTHERIALTARQLGFGQVRCSSPRLPEVLASLEFDA